MTSFLSERWSNSAAGADAIRNDNEIKEHIDSVISHTRGWNNHMIASNALHFQHCIKRVMKLQNEKGDLYCGDDQSQAWFHKEISALVLVHELGILIGKRPHPQRQDDIELVLPAVQKFGLVLRYASKRLQGTKEVVMAAAERHGEALEFASKELQDDEEVVKIACANIGSALEFASARLQGTKEVVMVAMEEGGYLEDASEGLRNDRAIVMAAVESSGSALEYASEELRMDREIVKVAIAEDYLAFQFASPELQHDPVIAILAVQKGEGQAWIMDLLPDGLRSNRQVIMSAIECNSLALSRASVGLQDDTEVVMAAISSSKFDEPRFSGICINNGYNDLIGVGVLQHVSNRLRNDEKVAMAAIVDYVYNIFYAGNELKKKIPWMAKTFAAIIEHEYFHVWNWGKICDRDLSCRISLWLDSFEDVAKDWLQAVEQTGRGVLDFGTDFMMSRACEKRWLLDQYFCQERLLLPVDVQNRICAFADVHGDFKAAQETVDLAPMLNYLFDPELLSLLFHFRDFE